MKAANETGSDRVDFASTHATDSTTWPYMHVSWAPKRGEMAFFPVQRSPLDDRMHLAVNLANGNLMVPATDLVMAGTGLPLVVDRTYSNLDNSCCHSVGNYWWLGTGDDVYEISHTDNVHLAVPGGYTAPFMRNAYASFRSPSGINATLVQQGYGTYPVTWHRSGERWNFDSSGRFASDVDANGNMLSFTYTAAGYVNTITDTQGRLTSFAYDPNNYLTVTVQRG